MSLSFRHKDKKNINTFDILCNFFFIFFVDFQSIKGANFRDHSAAGRRRNRGGDHSGRRGAGDQGGAQRGRARGQAGGAAGRPTERDPEPRQHQGDPMLAAAIPTAKADHSARRGAGARRRDHRGRARAQAGAEAERPTERGTEPTQDSTEKPKQKPHHLIAKMKKRLFINPHRRFITTSV